MNENPDAFNDEVVTPQPDPPKPHWREWCRRFFICNPFFLCSAALLLLAINRLSTDDRLFTADLHNLLFNFFALQTYEGIVIGTALLLVRRRIFYDSALLVVLDCGLALVPFMLISQASLEGTSLAWTLSASGGAMAALRFGGVRRWYSQFNLPARALAFGALILAANVALPLIFQPTVEPDLENWIRPNDFVWAFALPLLAAGANLLPRPSHDRQMNPGRPWIPLLVYALWTAGSGVHAWCLAHISSVPLLLHHLAPVLCVATWTLNHRLTDCVRSPSIRCQSAILLLTAPIPLLAYGQAEAFVLLGAINLPAYLLLLASKNRPEEIRRIAKHLAMATFALMFAVFPTNWVELLSPDFNLRRLALLGVAVYLVVLAVSYRLPELAIAGALGAGAVCGLLWASAAHQPIQVAFAFLVLHSLRWDDGRHSTVRYLRVFAIVGWILESFLWSRPLAPFDRDATIGAFVVLLAWVIVCYSGHRKTLWVPGGTLGVMLATPLQRGIQNGSPGVFSLIGSLLLFALGAWVAWNRARWTRPTEPADVDSPSAE